MKIFKSLLIFAGVLALAGCGSKGTDLTGKWNVTEVTINGEAQEIVPAFLGIESVEKGIATVFGNSGVNNFSGSFKMENGKISIPVELACTKMMGSKEEMSFEDAFLSAISYADSYELKDGVLKFINSKDSSVISFKK